MSELRAFFMDIYWLLQEIPTGIMMGDRGWARVRFWGVVLIFVVFIALGGLIWDHQALELTVQSWEASVPELEAIPQFILILVALFFTWQSLRYAILPLSVLVGALFWGAQYIQDIYELKSFRLALRYLIASIFGFSYPVLVIEDGKKQIKPGEENLLDIIGGPGYVVVRPGNAVLFESLRSPWGVAAAGTHFISRFQTIKEIADLRDQQDTIDRLAAVTKDGFVVAARDVHFRYRLWSTRKDGKLVGRTVDEPYPFSIQAVRNMAYNRAVRNDTLTSWRDTVRSLFEGEIQNYIRRNQVDQLTSPRNFEQSPTGRQRGQPRADIHNRYRSPELRRRFRDVGAELLWYGIGHFEVANPDVNQRRVLTWRNEWQQDAQKLLATSEARRQAYIDQGRAEAQASILMAIIDALEDMEASPEQLQGNLQEMFLMRMAQLLDALRPENPNPNPDLLQSGS